MVGSFVWMNSGVPTTVSQGVVTGTVEVADRLGVVHRPEERRSLEDKLSGAWLALLGVCLYTAPLVGARLTLNALRSRGLHLPFRALLARRQASQGRAGLLPSAAAVAGGTASIFAASLFAFPAIEEDPLLVRLLGRPRRVPVPATRPAEMTNTEFSAWLEEMLGYQQTWADSSDKLAAQLFAAVLAPCWEEVLFRGLLFGGLVSVSPLGAHVLSSALFGAGHYSPECGDAKVPQAAVTGLILSVSYHLTGRLLVPLLVHAINNAAAIWEMHANSAKERCSRDPQEAFTYGDGAFRLGHCCLAAYRLLGLNSHGDMLKRGLLDAAVLDAFRVPFLACSQDPHGMSKHEIAAFLPVLERGEPLDPSFVRTYAEVLWRLLEKHGYVDVETGLLPFERFAEYLAMQAVANPVTTKKALDRFRAGLVRSYPTHSRR